MGELLEEAIIGAIRNLSLSGFVNVWAISILATLSTCSVLKILVLFGYLAVLKLSDWRRLLSNVFMYILGMGFAYLLIVVLIIRAPSWAHALVSASDIAYVLAGVSIVAFGIVALGILKIPITRIELLSSDYPKHDYLIAFLLGAVLVCLEAISCPICNPTLKLVSAIYLKQGAFFAVLVFGTFFLGQSTLPMLVGLIIGPVKQLLAKRGAYEYVQIAGAIILILVGLDLLWLF